MKKISVVTPCYNEEGNVTELYNRVKAVFAALPQYQYEHLFIDNASKDGTVAILKGLAKSDPNVKIIVNVRNFGHIRSPFHALLQTQADATLLMAADLQDPPEVLPEFLKKWEEGFKVVLGVKNKSEESALMFAIRKMYYNFISRVSDIELVKNATGFGLYDRAVIDQLRAVNDPYPYFRGLIAELGYQRAIVTFTQPTRKRGISSNNFYTLYDMAMLGITNHSKVPLRIATMMGFLLSILSLFIAFGYLIAKLIFWNSFSVGVAPMVIGIFFFSSVQLFFIGIIGEYIGSIQTQILRRPLVTEKERVNF
ncbi:MAG: glycosyltransferase family 2 protein [Oligoflexia bacterium]|nr:glycosyltransferase family 2 protein [Oligoflexia bacterium]